MSRHAVCDHVNDCALDRCGCVISGCHGRVGQADVAHITVTPESRHDLTPEDLTDRHWLIFNNEREVVGCHCGFGADNEQDCGWGDSVVDHLFRVAMAEVAAAVEALLPSRSRPAPDDVWPLVNAYATGRWDLGRKIRAALAAPWLDASVTGRAAEPTP